MRAADIHIYCYQVTTDQRGSPLKSDNARQPRPSASPGHKQVQEDKGKRKADATEPTDSLLHRLAGPSTGKAGLKREYVL